MPFVLQASGLSCSALLCTVLYCTVLFATVTATKRYLVGDSLGLFVAAFVRPSARLPCCLANIYINTAAAVADQSRVHLWWPPRGVAR